MTRTLIVFLFLAVLSSTGRPCSCVETTFEQRYCDASVTIAGAVVAKTDNCPGKCDEIEDQGEGVITYIVRVVRLYKWSEITDGVKEDGVMYLNTAVNSALCGVNLLVGETYLFNLGPVTIGDCARMVGHVNLCNFPSSWGMLSEAEEEFLYNASMAGEVCKDKAANGDKPVKVGPVFVDIREPRNENGHRSVGLRDS